MMTLLACARASHIGAVAYVPPGASDAGTGRDEGDAGAGSIAAGTDGGGAAPDASTPTADAGQAACPFWYPDAGQSPLCRTDNPPAPPAVFLDGGVPGACEEWTWWGADLHSHVTNRWDAQGRLLAHAELDGDGGVLLRQTYAYDQCGNFVYGETGYSRSETDYGDDGLPMRSVFADSSHCTVHFYRWVFDPQGRATDEFEDDGAHVLQRSYDDAGNVGAIVNYFNDAGAGETDYSSMPDGGLRISHQSYLASVYNQQTYDPAGYLIDSESNSFSANYRSESWQYDPDHHLLAHSVSSQGIGCSDGFSQEIWRWDGGVLVSEDDLGGYATSSGGICHEVQNSSHGVYSYPAPNVVVEESLDTDGGVLASTRSTLDANGNVLQIEVQQPDGSWLTTVRRKYDCP